MSVPCGDGPFLQPIGTKEPLKKAPLDRGAMIVSRHKINGDHQGGKYVTVSGKKRGSRLVRERTKRNRHPLTPVRTPNGRHVQGGACSCGKCGPLARFAWEYLAEGLSEKEAQAKALRRLAPEKHVRFMA
jgi:hypothetical protein